MVEFGELLEVGFNVLFRHADFNAQNFVWIVHFVVVGGIACPMDQEEEDGPAEAQNEMSDENVNAGVIWTCKNAPCSEPRSSHLGQCGTRLNAWPALTFVERFFSLFCEERSVKNSVRNDGERTE